MTEERNIFEVITDYSVNERMNKVLLGTSNIRKFSTELMIRSSCLTS